eukprot:scaffold111636_cov63-Phaeocystis_antarctica.AAC.1
MFEYHTWAGMTLPSTYQGVGERARCRKKRRAWCWANRGAGQEPRKSEGPRRAQAVDCRLLPLDCCRSRMAAAARALAFLYGLSDFVTVLISASTWLYCFKVSRRSDIFPPSSD